MSNKEGVRELYRPKKVNWWLVVMGGLESNIVPREAIQVGDRT